MSCILWVNESVTPGEALGFYLLPFSPGHLVLCSLSDLTSRVKCRVVGRVLAYCQARHIHLQSGLQPGQRSWAATAAESECAQRWGGGRDCFSIQSSNSLLPASCSLCCSRWPPEGANKRQPVVCPVTIYQLSALQGSAAPTRALKVQHAGSLGELGY